MQRVTITIDDDLLAAIDALAQRRGYQSRSEAMREEIRIKRLPRAQKRALAAAFMASPTAWGASGPASRSS